MPDYGMFHMHWLAFAIFGGLVITGVYVVALWRAVRKPPERRQPIPAMLFNLLLRVAVVLTGFFWIANGNHWSQLLIAVAGFVALRAMLALPAKQRAESVRENRRTLADFTN